MLNGGVSLAVWMGGVALELDRLVKAPGRSDEPYAALLRLAGCTARVDVISGTSAGGVNGAALALAQVNRRADMAALRDVWVEQGRIEALLRQPFRGAPSSLLKGDEHFLPQLNAALTSLAVPTDVVPARDAPIDLTMMTTVLNGNQQVTVDALGQRLPQSVHGARFHWKRPVDVTDDVDPFGLAKIRDTAAQLALAARGSSSFPLAFEPAFVPVSPLEGRRPAPRRRPPTCAPTWATSSRTGVTSSRPATGRGTWSTGACSPTPPPGLRSRPSSGCRPTARCGASCSSSTPTLPSRVSTRPTPWPTPRR